MKDVSAAQRSYFPARTQPQKGKPAQAETSISRAEIEEKYEQAVRQDPDYPRFVSFKAFARRFQASEAPKQEQPAPETSPSPKDVQALYNEQVRADPDYPRFVSYEAFARRHGVQPSSEAAPRSLFME